VTSRLVELSIETAILPKGRLRAFPDGDACTLVVNLGANCGELAQNEGHLRPTNEDRERTLTSKPERSSEDLSLCIEDLS